MDFSKLPPMLTTDQAAAVLNTTRKTVTKMCQTGRIKAVKCMSLWRINRDALLEYAGLARDGGGAE